MPRVQTGMVAPRYKSRRFPRTHAVVRVSFQVVKTHNRSPLFDSLRQFDFPYSEQPKVVRFVAYQMDVSYSELHRFRGVSTVEYDGVVI